MTREKVNALSRVQDASLVWVVGKVMISIGQSPGKTPQPEKEGNKYDYTEQIRSITLCHLALPIAALVDLEHMYR